jgi:hypothetical protein
VRDGLRFFDCFDFHECKAKSRLGGAVSGRPPDATLLRLEARLVAIDSKIDVLLARLAPGPRDRGDEHLVGIIAKSTRGLTFTAKAAWIHQRTDPALADALAECDIESPRQLGKLLRRLEGRTVGSVRIVCVEMHRDGKVWRAEVRE